MTTLPHDPSDLLGSADQGIFEVTTSARGPVGALPLSGEMLREWPSGDLFGLSQDAGMGWEPARLRQKEFLILSTQGGIRAPDGTPIALGYHTGHWEVGLLMAAAAEQLRADGYTPFAAFVTDPCDGRYAGDDGDDGLAGLPQRRGTGAPPADPLTPDPQGRDGRGDVRQGSAGDDIALAAMHDLPCILVPGGVTLPASGGEDAGKIQTIGARFSHHMITLEQAADLGCRACATPGGGCQFLGTAATAQVVAEALGLTLPHSALAPSGQPIWLDMARRSARALAGLEARGHTTRDILTEKALQNAMVVHAAFGGSTNLLLHIPAIAHAAGLRRPTVEDWHRVNVKVPRLVDALPNGPVNHPTVRVFLAGGVPEVMLHLRELGLLHLDALTVSGLPLGEVLDWWSASERRTRAARAPARTGRRRRGRGDHGAGLGPRPWPDQHRHLPARQPGPARRRGQKHLDRSQRRRRRRRLPQSRAGAGLHQRARRNRRRSRAKGPSASKPARSWS